MITIPKEWDNDKFLKVCYTSRLASYHFIAGSSKCTTKDLSCLFTKVLTTVKDGLIRYNNTKTSRNGVISMWIVKNSTSLLPFLDQLDVCTATPVQTYDFSILYASIPSCTHQSHTICFSLELLHFYTTHSRGEMEVTDIPTSKLRVEGGIS